MIRIETRILTIMTPILKATMASILITAELIGAMWNHRNKMIMNGQLDGRLNVYRALSKVVLVKGFLQSRMARSQQQLQYTLLRINYYPPRL
jgi:hypothetical protein